MKNILQDGRNRKRGLPYQCEPNLENRIISLKSTYCLSDKRFSHFLQYLVAQRMGLLTTKFGPARIGFWNACVARGSKAEGSVPHHPARGLKHLAIYCPHFRRVQYLITPQGD